MPRKPEEHGNRKYDGNQEPLDWESIIHYLVTIKISF